MPRVAFMMRLKPGNEAIYKEKHDRIWPEMVSLLRESGVRTDLVASTRIGLVELVLREGDVVVDRG